MYVVEILDITTVKQLDIQLLDMFCTFFEHTYMCAYIPADQHRKKIHDPASMNNAVLFVHIGAILVITHIGDMAWPCPRPSEHF